METRKLGVLAVFNDKKEIIAIVYHHEPSRSQVVCNVEKSGIDEIESLFNNLINKQ